MDEQFPPLHFTYKNYKGEISKRQVRPLTVWYGKNEPYHTEDAWMMTAYDLDKKALRSFVIKEMILIRG